MNKQNNTLRIFALLFMAIGVMTFTSCKKEGCTNPKAENYDAKAKTDDGSCKIKGCTDNNAENYDADATDDDGSCVLAREKFLGTYTVNETCNSGTFNYTLTVSTSTAGDEFIILNNLYYSEAAVKATVNGSNINFNDTQGGINYSGTGSISGTTLTLIYTASANGLTDDCTATCIKQ